MRRARLGPDHLDTLASLANLSAMYTNARKVDVALPLAEESLRRYRDALGPDHATTLVSMNNLAITYRAAGRADEALRLDEDTLRRRRTHLGPNHPDTLQSLNNLAGSYYKAGRVNEALPLLEEAHRLRAARFGPDHPKTLQTANNLALAYGDAGRPEAALRLLEEVVKVRRAKFGLVADTLNAMVNLGSQYREAGKFEQAEPLYRDLVDGIERRGNASSGPHMVALTNLGITLLARRKWADAEPVLARCLALREAATPDAWTTFNVQSLLGESRLRQGKTAEAEPNLRGGYDGLKARAAAIPAGSRHRLADAAERLAKLYDTLGEPDQAAAWLDEMWAWADLSAAVTPRP